MKLMIAKAWYHARYGSYDKKAFLGVLISMVNLSYGKRNITEIINNTYGSSVTKEKQIMVGGA